MDGAGPEVGAEDAGSQAAAWCAALDAENEARLATLSHGPGAGCEIVQPDVQCASRGGIAWGYRLVAAGAKRDADASSPPDLAQCKSTARVELVRRDAKGSSVVAGGGESLDYDWTTKERSIRLVVLSDYDGDGEPELLRTHEELFHESSPERKVDVLTYKGGALSPYLPAKGIDVDRVLDIDDDGLLDLVSTGPYARVDYTDHYDNSWRVAPALLAWHAEPGGSFSLVSAASVAFTRKACPTRPTVAFTPQALGPVDPEVVHDVLCEALWGGNAAIAAAWNKACASFDASDEPSSCKDWPRQISRIKPPFILH